MSFLVQRGIRLLLLPTIFSAFTLFTSRRLGLPGGAVAGVALGLAAIWLPTTLWMTWARFWRPSDDDHGLILTSGEVLDRAAFQHLVRAQAAEVALVAIGMLAMSAAFPLRFGWAGSPVLIAALGAIVWVVVVLRARLWFALASVRLTEGDAPGTLVALRKSAILRIRRRSREILDATASTAYAELGQVEQAEQAAERIRSKQKLLADILLAKIRLGRGEMPSPALLNEEPSNLARAVTLDSLRAMYALYRSDPATALQHTGSWESERAWLPMRHRRTFDVLTAAAHRAQNNPSLAARALARTETRIEDLEAPMRCYPWLWALLTQGHLPGPEPAGPPTQDPLASLGGPPTQAPASHAESPGPEPST